MSGYSGWVSAAFQSPRGFGIKNSKTGEPVKDDTVFEAASLTKPFFAFLVMKLVEDGKLDLDKPLVTYAPEDYIVQNIIRHPLKMVGGCLTRSRS